MVNAGLPAVNGIQLPPVPKNQLHFRARPHSGKITGQHFRPPAQTAGLPKQRVTDRVKDGGLPRAGGTGDEKNPLAAQGSEINDRSVLISAKRRHGKGQRLHSVTPASRAAAKSTAHSSSFGGLPPSWA